MKESRFEPLLNMRVQPKFHFFNEEWNEYPQGTIEDDEGHEDFVDSFDIKEKDTTYYDDYEDYGN